MQQYRALQKTNVRTFCDQRFLTIMLFSYTLHWKAIIMETFLSTPPDLMSPGLERHHYHVCPSWWHHPLSKQYHRTDDKKHNDDITTNNYITLNHDNKPHRRLSLTVRAQWDRWWGPKSSEIETGHLFSIVKLNFNVGLLSCIFWFEAIFISKSAIFCRSLFTREKGPK